VIAAHQARRIPITTSADLRTLAGVMTVTSHPSVGVLEAANWRRWTAEDQEGVEGDEVWVSREAQIELGAKLIGPVFIGPGCHVASQATLGPGVILGRDVQIGADLTLCQTVVLDGLIIDGGMDIRESLVHARGIANFAWQVVVPAHALGSLLTAGSDTID